MSTEDVLDQRKLRVCTLLHYTVNSNKVDICAQASACGGAKGWVGVGGAETKDSRALLQTRKHISQLCNLAVMVRFCAWE